MTSLAALVAAAPGSLVLPPGERRAQVDVAMPLSLVDSADLGSGRHVAVVQDADGGRWTVPLMADRGAVRRAVPGDGVAEALVRAITDVRRMRRDKGTPSTQEGAAVQGQTAFVADGWYGEELRGERGLSVDQTNESIVVGERAMVKWAVHLPRAGVRGAQPAADRMAVLTRAGFAETPRPWGLLRWIDEVGDPHDLTSVLLAAVTGFLPGAQDGWDWAVDDVRRAALHETPLDDALDAPRRLGGLTARLHVALAARGVTPATDDDVAQWRARALADLEEAVSIVPGHEGERLRVLAPRIASAYDAVDGCAGTPQIAVHGDYHVGQVLRHPSGDPGAPWAYAVTDFDGNPVLPPEERSRPQPAALDVAGMLASLDHVGRVVDKRVDGADPDVTRAWIEAAQRDYLDACTGALDDLGHAHLLDERLLAPLRLQQEVREHLYAVRHLPHWVYVPDAALAALLPIDDEGAQRC